MVGKTRKCANKGKLFGWEKAKMCQPKWEDIWCGKDEHVLTKGDIWFRKEENVLSKGRNLVRRSKMCYRREDIWFRTIKGRIFGLEKTNMCSQRKILDLEDKNVLTKGKYLVLKTRKKCANKGKIIVYGKQEYSANKGKIFGMENTNII